jgi:hypothetical protein
MLLFTAMGNGAAAKSWDGLGHLGFSVKLLFSRRKGWMIVNRSPGSHLKFTGNPFNHMYNSTKTHNHYVCSMTIHEGPF